MQIIEGRSYKCRDGSKELIVQGETFLEGIYFGFYYADTAGGERVFSVTGPNHPKDLISMIDD